MIEKKERINSLLDLYGSLLTKHQEEIARLYYGEDFSLQEIAEQYDITRSAVLDNLKKCEKTLEEYEEKMGLLDKEKLSTSPYIIVRTFTDDKTLAHKIARELLKLKLVACAQIKEVESIWHWKGKTEGSTEYEVALKTKRSKFIEIEKIIKRLHNYELGEISIVEMEGSKEFLAWIDKEVGE